MEELGKAFEKETGTKVLFNFAGSNDLAHQLIAAHKGDLFLSAAENWMDSVEKAGRLVPGSRGDLLSNSLVVVAHKGSTMNVSEPCALATLPFKHLALADPEAVPAGKYARKWLSTVVCSGDTLWNRLKDKVAPAPDVRAALGQVMADPDQVGIVYKTDWLAAQDKTDMLFEVKDGPPIKYVIAQAADGAGGEDGAKFLAYLRAPAARALFEKHGFTFITPAPR